VEIGESLTRSPLDGPRETRSPDTNEERPRPATGWSARWRASPERQSV